MRNRVVALERRVPLGQPRNLPAAGSSITCAAPRFSNTIRITC